MLCLAAESSSPPTLKMCFNYKTMENEKKLVEMAETDPHSSSADSKSGFCSKTKIFHSLRPPAVSLPPENFPLSTAQYAFSLLQSSTSWQKNNTALIDSSTGTRLTYFDFLQRTHTLAASLQARFGLSKGDTAFILSPTSLQIPILYFSLLSLGVITSPANPVTTISEVYHLISLSKPVITFATSTTAHKLSYCLPLRTLLIDSDEFQSMMISCSARKLQKVKAEVVVEQSDPAAILYSSGTTGGVKGVELTHRNLIALLAGHYMIVSQPEPAERSAMTLFTVPLFHSFGLLLCLKAIALGETLVLMEKFDFVGMLKAIQAYQVTYMPVAPSIVVAMVKSDVVDKYNLSSLSKVECGGGASLGKEVSIKFSTRYPNVQLVQTYGLTEAAGVTKMLAPTETAKYGSVGHFVGYVEAKIVDPVTGDALSPGQKGELWLRGPIIMKGYVGDIEATASMLNSEGWLKTGDLVYVDSDGFIYIINKLKELIKYKGFQVPPAELEHLLQSHREIADVAVIPYPDEEAGQVPMAFVVRKPNSMLSEAQVMDFIAKQVEPNKKISRVAFINSIPRSSAGKILRRELIQSAIFATSAKL